jgi:peptidoglycan-associated lipoprotein
MRTRVLALSAVVLGMCIAGCHHRVPAAATPAATPPPATVSTPPRAPAPASAPPARARAAEPPVRLSDDELFRRKSLAELNAERPLGDVFFDFQKDDIRDDGRNVLQQDAAWLEKHPSTRISIEGHCDDRGTAEYNLALGSRRAEAVRAYLATLGIATDRLSVTSYGKESPFCSGTGESCWSQNRRDHFMITAK